MSTKQIKASIAVELLIVYLGVLAVVVLMQITKGLSTSRGVKMALMVGMYIMFAAVPVGTMLLRKIPLSTLGFSKHNIGRQLFTAIPIAVVTLTLVVALPLLMGASKTDVLSFKSSSLGVLVFYVLYDLVCVGFGEEIVFRGYFLNRLKDITAIKWLPLVLSSVLFGLMHYPSTYNFLNVAVTTLLGLFYGFCRLKIKGCSLLSVSLAHGLNDAVIVILSYVLL